MAYILVVDDEEKLLSLISKFLTTEGFHVEVATAGKEGLLLMQKIRFDLIVLDWMLPDMTGLDVIRKIRKENNIPVIFLTAKSSEVDKLVGLELGADDYITKPFSLRELAARIRVVLRRVDTQFEQHIWQRLDLKIEPDNFRVLKANEEIPLTPSEFKILRLLASQPGRVFTRLQLVETILGEAYDGYERSIDTHISNIRKKLSQDEYQYIETVHGVGYKFTGEKR